MKGKMYRTYLCSELREKHVGEEISLAGWVDTIRDLGGVLFTSLKHHNTAYIITDKSIYISGGTFTKNIQTFSFSDVSNIEIHRGLFDQMFNVGDIIVTSYNRDHNGKRVTANISSVFGYLDIYNLVKNIYNNEKDNY